MDNVTDAFLEAEIDRLFGDLLCEALDYAVKLRAGDEADEIAAEVTAAIFTKFFVKSTGDVREPGFRDRMFRYMRRATYNAVKKRWTRRRTRAEKEQQHALELEASTLAWTRPDVALEASRLEAAYKQTLATLTPRCRQAFQLVAEEGLSYIEAGERMGVTSSSISSWCVTARARLRAMLLAEGIDPPKPRSTPPRTQPKPTPKQLFVLSEGPARAPPNPKRSSTDAEGDPMPSSRAKPRARKRRGLDDRP